MRSSNRRFATIGAVVAALALVLAACSSDSGSTSSSGSGSSSGTAPGGEDLSSLSGSLPGSGATFPQAFYEEAITEFQDVAPDLQVTYGGGGSGKGKQDLADQISKWAGTDSLVKDADLAGYKGGPIFYFPTVAAPITVSYNLDGADGLQLDGDTIARIFQREITSWDDPAIVALNEELDLPAEPIVVARRADGSGTTTNFTKYLTKAAPQAWTLGSSDTVDWPSDTQAGQGNGGVAQIVQSTQGSIGYIDLSDAVASNLQIAAVENAAGNFVEPSLEAASAALAGAEVEADLTYDPLDAAGADSYPITAPTWIITYQTVSAADLANLQGWLTYVLTEAQEIAPEVDYAPLPPELQEKALEQVSQIVAG